MGQSDATEPESQAQAQAQAYQGNSFNTLDADDINSEPTEIESLCMECGENGMTRLLLTRVPHYRELILSSFNCPHCGASNNEIQSGGVIQEKGVRLTVTITNERDLSRQVVKSDSASLLVPCVELEIPANTQKGEITTVEGVLQRTISSLQQDQTVRRALHPEDAEDIEKFVTRLQDLLRLVQPFTITLDDPSGNSFIENPFAPGPDPGRKLEQFVRTQEQDNQLGLYSQEQLRKEYVQEEEDSTALQEEDSSTALTAERLQEEVLSFPTNCPECNEPAATKMKMTNIPYFKEVVIMCTSCDHCGSKTNEVKSGGGIEEKGKKITLRVTDPSDMNRDVLKSETCSIAIPELDFEIGGNSLGGKFTTLEGLLTNVIEQIEKNSMWGGGDAVATDIDLRMKEFKKRYQSCIEGSTPFTLVLDDPAGNSYLQNVYAPEEDPELNVEHYERNFEQNDDLGLNDMKVEGYEEGER